MKLSNIKIGIITVLASILATIILVIMVIFALPFLEPKGDVSQVALEYETSIKFSDEEIEAAMEAVKERFGQNFEYCKLLSLIYDEERSNYTIENTLKKETHIVDYVAMDSNNIMVLFCKFDTGENGSAWSSSYPSHIIIGSHEWALTREDRDSEWVVSGNGML